MSTLCSSKTNLRSIHKSYHETETIQAVQVFFLLVDQEAGWSGNAF